MSVAEVIALVPMRHHSERVPGKDYSFLAERPLYYHVVGSLLASSFISDVVIDTDGWVIGEDG